MSKSKKRTDKAPVDSKIKGASRTTVLKALGEKRVWWDRFSAEELLAFEILLGLKPVRDERSKVWAIKLMKQTLEARLIGVSVHQAFETDRLDDVLKLMEFFVGKAKTVVEASGPDGGDIPVVVKSVAQEAVVAALLKEVGRPGSADRDRANMEEET